MRRNRESADHIITIIFRLFAEWQIVSNTLSGEVMAKYNFNASKVKGRVVAIVLVLMNSGEEGDYSWNDRASSSSIFLVNHGSAFRQFIFRRGKWCGEMRWEQLKDGVLLLNFACRPGSEYWSICKYKVALITTARWRITFNSCEHLIVRETDT